MARRKRRTRTEALAKRTLIEIKAKKRQFLKDVGAILTEALGFTVKVSLANNNKADLSPDERRASRMSRKAARASIKDAGRLAGFGDPPPKGNIFGDDVGI